MTAANDHPSRRWLIFSDGDLGSALRAVLEREGDIVTTAVAADEFSVLDDRSYSIHPDEPRDYERLFKELKESADTPENILHLWTVPHTDGDNEPAAFERHQTAGFHSLICLAQGLEKTNVTTQVQVGVVSSQLHAVSPTDRPCPAKSTLLGASKVLPQEFPNLHWKTIDIDQWSRDQASATAERIVAELTEAPPDPVVAYRDGQRWVQEFVPSPLDEAPQESIRLRKGGVYLITGGLGNIGLEFAEALAARVQAKLVLIGRSPFPDRTEWDERLTIKVGDHVNRKILRLKKMEELGSEVLVLRADSADRRQMAAAVAEAYERFGVVHGVIHGAGNTTGGGFTDARHTDRAAATEHFRPKAQGLFVLEELFRDRPVDFVLLLSSLSGVLGGLGLLSYSAANIFLDAFAARENQLRRVPWISVNWDAWQFPGQEEEFRQTAPQGADFLYPAEGVNCLFRILESAPAQIVVSTSDLKVRIDKWIRLESVRRQQAASHEPAAGTLHARPNLSSQFVAPRTGVETTLAGIWEQILGVAPIGIYDKFFELGGHSLLAIQLISRMRDAFHVELSAQRLFEAPTIVQLAATIEADVKALRRAEEDEDARIEEMLKMVEQLSEEEVAALLSKQDHASKATAENA